MNSVIKNHCKINEYISSFQKVLCKINIKLLFPHLVTTKIHLPSAVKKVVYAVLKR